MPRSAAVLALSCALLLAVPGALAAPAGSYKGKATSKDGTFNYGKVTFTVSGSKIKNLRIQGVTTSGCGGFKDVIVPKLTIKGSSFSATYKPVKDVDDTIKVKGTFKGSTAKGTFEEGPVCVNAGRFTAKR